MLVFLIIFHQNIFRRMNTRYIVSRSDLRSMPLKVRIWKISSIHDTHLISNVIRSVVTNFHLITGNSLFKLNKMYISTWSVISAEFFDPTVMSK